MAGDTARLLRRHRPERQAGPLLRRPGSQLRWAEIEPPAPTRLLLDTCVYIDRLKGRLDGAVDAWLDRAVLRHSVVARAELVLGLGFADPRHPGYAVTRAQVLALLDRTPPHTTLGLDGSTLEEAGLIAGIIARRHGLAPAAAQRCATGADGAGARADAADAQPGGHGPDRAGGGDGRDPILPRRVTNDGRHSTGRAHRHFLVTPALTRGPVFEAAA